MDATPLSVADLVAALAEGQLELWLQPVVDGRDGSVPGFEGLARWRHPERGVLGPAAFLPLVDAGGLEGDLDTWAVDAGIAAAQALADAFPRPPRVWVNLSAAALATVEVAAAVRERLARAGLHGRALGLEVTESAVLDDIDTAAEALAMLRGLGVETALDDFGTGYSSLARLRRLPVHSLKIDRSFVTDVTRSLPDAAIVAAVVDLAHGFGMRVVAEGVEDLDQLDQLISFGVDKVQGYYLARPAPLEDAIAAARHPWCGARPPTVRRDGPDADHRLDDIAGTAGVRGRLLMTALDATPDPVMLTTLRAPRRGIYVNTAFTELTGYRLADLEITPLRTLAMHMTQAKRTAYDTPAALVSGIQGVHEHITVASGELLPVELNVTPVVDDLGQPTHLMFLLRDRRETARAEERERYYQRLRTVVWEAAQDAVDLGPEAFLDQVAVTMGRVGEALGADLGWIDVIVDGRLADLAGWTASHLGRGPMPPPAPAIDEIPRWMGLLSELRPFAIDGETTSRDEVNDIPMDPAFAAKAVVGSPLSIGGELFGVVAFAMVTPPRYWVQEELAAVRTLAGTIANAVRWQRAPVPATDGRIIVPRPVGPRVTRRDAHVDV